jgi:hypothetical protein
MADSMCKIVVHSHDLLINKCIEGNINCAKCEELANHLKEVLTELSSVQLIIKLLQKELNTTLVNNSKHNHMYVTSCTKQESGESNTNIECISVNKSREIPVNLNSFVTPKKYAKWGEYAIRQTYKNFKSF